MQVAHYTGAIAWDDRGLAPALVQHATTGEMLMVAWMNEEALARTRATGLVHFYSRSRKALWQKGESSGNTLKVWEVRTDCDRDAILVQAEPSGPACHTGSRSCFFRLLEGDPIEEAQPTRAPEDAAPAGAGDDGGPGGVPAAIVERVYALLRARKQAKETSASYTAALLEKGVPAIVDKIAEEQLELAEELPGGDPDRVVHETADLLFHVLVALVARDIPPAAVWGELERRFGTSGHAEKAARSPAPMPTGG